LIAAIFLLIYPNHAPSQQLYQDPSARTDALAEAAEKGDARSQCELAKTYLEKRNDPQSLAEAVKWFRKAADQGFAEAQGWIGALYDAGLGVSRNYIEASRWYRTAAENGNLSARVNLGFMYQQGRNNPQSVLGLNGERLVWPDDGGGVVLQDYAQAAKWYRIAAEQGSSFAQSSLGWMHFQGRGVDQDSVLATGWFFKAAEQGEISAQCILGVLYAEGKATPPDYVQAHRWLSLCANATQGKKRELATKLLDDISRQMNPQQMAESQRLASILDPKFAQPGRNGHYVVGREVIAPVILLDPKPSYTEQARKERAQGVVLAQCIVRKDGTVGSCKIARELGYGLDESAVCTITARWRFKPGTLNGEPVDVLILIETSFRLY
jgi:TonB family protein